jgi:hypothetical protein
MICAPDHTLHNSRTQIWSWHSGSKNFRYDGHYTGYSNGVRTRYGQSSSSYQLGQQVPDDISLQNHCSGQISNIGQTCQPGSNVCGYITRFSDWSLRRKIKTGTSVLKNNKASVAKMTLALLFQKEVRAGARPKTH